MKKIITLLAVFLIGTASVFAQWDCEVSWVYLPDADCQPEHLPTQGTYHIEVTLVIYDQANGEYLTGANPPVKTVSTSTTSTTFSAAQCGVSAYCNVSHDNTPNFYIYAKVAFVSSTSEEFCSDNGQNISGLSCNQFYTGQATVEVDMD